MAENDRTTEILRRLVALVAENGLAELTVEEDGLVVSVKGFPEAAAAQTTIPLHFHPQALPHAQTSSYSETAIAPQSDAASPAGVGAVTRLAFESPMMGTFYRSPAPGDPPFINVGDAIQVGQPVGLIEAMKVYSELPSEVAGRIVEIAAGDGQLVRQGQPILYVEPL